MLDINSNKEKIMVFEVDIHGVEDDELAGSVKFLINGVEYGFPASIDRGKIEALVPPLSKVVGWEIEEGTVVEARLDLNTDEFFFTPWHGKVKITAPRKVTAKLEGESFMSDKPTVKVKKVSRGINEPISDREVQANVGINQTLKDLVRRESGTARVKTQTKKQPKTVNLNELRKMATKENIFKFMEKHGTKNKKIQEIVYEQALQAAGGEKDMLAVLKKVTEAMRIRK